ncbi:MAG: adenylate/guanylate cyclase domain-containing protein [Chromatiales bacterium]
MKRELDREFEDLLIAYTRQTAAGARREIEETIWARYGSEQAVLALDMSGFSLLSQRYGIIHYLSMIRRMQLTALPIVESHLGRAVKFEADNCFAVFPEPLHAVRAAVAMNLAFQASNLITTDELDIRIACGIDFGRILLLGDGDLFGNPVNRAAKLGEDVAACGEVLITRDAMDRIPSVAEIRGRPIELSIAGIPLPALAIDY